MISYSDFYRAPSFLPVKQDHTLSAIAFGCIAPGLSIKLVLHNVCFGSTFSYNVILIEAKSLQNWQDDKSLAGNILSLPYLALHVTSNTEWHPSYISLCVCVPVCTQVLYPVKLSFINFYKLFWQNFCTCFRSHASKFLYTFTGSLSTLCQRRSKIWVSSPKSIREKSELEFNTFSPAGCIQKHFWTVVNKVSQESDFQVYHC